VWALLTRRLRLVGTAASVVAAGFAAYCLRAGVSPVAVGLPYVNILRELNTGAEPLSGLAEVRPLIARIVTNFSMVDALVGAVSVLMLAAICCVARSESTQRTAWCSAPALVGVWSLLTFYHMTSGFVVLLPAAAFLLFAEGALTPVRTTLFWIMQLGLMIDVPGVWRRVRVLVPQVDALDDFAFNFDRVLMFVMLCGLMALASALARSRAWEAYSSPSALEPARMRMPNRAMRA